MSDTDDRAATRIAIRTRDARSGVMPDTRAASIDRRWLLGEVDRLTAHMDGLRCALADVWATLTNEDPGDLSAMPPRPEPASVVRAARGLRRQRDDARAECERLREDAADSLRMIESQRRDIDTLRAQLLHDSEARKSAERRARLDADGVLYADAREVKGIVIDHCEPGHAPPNIHARPGPSRTRPPEVHGGVIILPDDGSRPAGQESVDRAATPIAAQALPQQASPDAPDGLPERVWIKRHPESTGLLALDLAPIRAGGWTCYRREDLSSARYEAAVDSAEAAHAALVRLRQWCDVEGAAIRRDEQAAGLDSRYGDAAECLGYRHALRDVVAKIDRVMERPGGEGGEGGEDDGDR